MLNTILKMGLALLLALNLNTYSTEQAPKKIILDENYIKAGAEETKAQRVLRKVCTSYVPIMTFVVGTELFIYKSTSVKDGGLIIEEPFKLVAEILTTLSCGALILGAWLSYTETPVEEYVRLREQVAKSSERLATLEELIAKEQEEQTKKAKQNA